MDIKDFVSDALIQIHEGLIAAQASSGKGYYISNGNGATGKKGVLFSLAVTNSTNDEASRNKSGGSHIKVIEASLSNLKKSTESFESVSRLEFNVIVP